MRIGSSLALTQWRKTGVAAPSGPYAAYAANNVTPDTFADFGSTAGAYGQGLFVVGGTEVAHDTFATFARSGNATVFDSDGTLKWGAHNLFQTSTTPATQGVTVVSGADYTIAFKGTGSITYSGAASGTLNGTGAGNLVSVEVTASTTTLTCTVSGTITVARVYRSDLGGMQNNPDPDDATDPTYIEAPGAAAVYKRRVNHVYNGTSWVQKQFIEPVAATNLMLNSRNATTTGWSSTLTATRDQTGIDGAANTATQLANTSPTTGYTQQVVTTAAAANDICMWGFVKKTSGATVYPSVLLSYGGTAHWAHIDTNNGTIHQRTGVSLPDTYGVEDYGDWWLVWFTSNNLTSGTTTYLRYYSGGTSDLATYSGTLTNSITIDHHEILDGATLPGSPIPTAGATATRNAETYTIPLANLPDFSGDMSVIENGAVIYDGSSNTMWDITRNSNIYFRCYMRNVASTYFRRFSDGGAPDYTAEAGVVAAGVNTAYQVAFRFGVSESTQGSVDGTAGSSVVTTTTSDLTGYNFQLTPSGANGSRNVELLRLFAADVGTTGIEETWSRA